MRASSIRRQRLHVESIEPRILFSADPASALLHTTVGIVPPEQVIAGEPAQQPVDTSTVTTTATETHHELVFIDGRVTDQQQLIDDIRRAHGNEVVEIVVLDPGRDGIEQIGERLAQEHGLDAVHIISHAKPGVVQIGATRLDFATLLDDATAIARWRSALNPGADLLLYGCDLAASEDGRSLVDALSRLTGADVAASVDTTSGTRAGGDWVLEYSTGLIQADAPASASDLAAWDGTLAITSPGTETRANTTTSGSQTTWPARKEAAIDSSGNFVVVWNDGNSSDIYARRYDAAGNPLSSEFRVNTNTTSPHERAVVAMNASGMFVVVWQSDTQDPDSSMGIYAQVYDASGTAVGGEIRINQTTTNDQQSPSVAMDAAGNFVVSWTSTGQDSSGTYGVYARRFNSTGTALGNEFLVNTTTAGDQEASSVAVNASGDFVVTWQSTSGQDGNGAGAYARRYDSAGVAQTGELLVNTSTSGDQSRPSVAITANGDFMVTWSGAGTGGTASDAYGQRFNSAGVKQGGELRINQTTTNDQDYPVVAADSKGNFLVTWESNNQDGSGWGVYGRLVSSNGSFLTNETLINTTTIGTQDYPSVAWNGTQAVFFWEGNGPGDSTGVFFKTFTVTAPGVTVSPISGNTTEAAGTASFSVVLDDQPTADVTIAIASGDGTEGTASTSSLTFTSANWNIAQVVTVTGADDAMDDGDIGFSVVTGAAVSSDANYSGLAVADVAVTNVDNDTAGVTVIPLTPAPAPAPGFDLVAAGGETRVNVNTAGTQSLDRFGRRVATDAAGNFVIAWTTNASADGQGDVLVRRFAADGTPLSGDITVNTTSVGRQIQPSVDMDAQGNFVVCWMSDGQDGSGWGIYAQRFDAPGAKLGAEFRVNQVTAGDQSSPSLAMSPTGEFVVTWQGVDASGLGAYARRYAADGTALGNEFRVNTSTLADQYMVAVDMNANNDFVIAWTSSDNGLNVNLQRYDANGVAQGGEQRVNALYDAWDPSVAIDDNGNCVVVWSPGAYAFGQRFDAAGVAQGGQFRVSVSTANAGSARVAFAADGDFVVAWEGGTGDVFLRHFAADGTPLTGDMLVNTTVAGNQAYMSVAMSGDSAIVAWSSPSATDNSDVYFQRFQPPGITSEDGGTTRFSVALDSQPTADVTISIASNDTTEGTVSTSLLTFTAANWNVAQQVTVTGVDDAVDDGDIAYSIVTTTASSGDATYNGMDAADVATINVDNDIAGISVSPISGNTYEAGGAASFSVMLTSQPTADVTISITSGTASEGAISTSALTFTSANWNVSQLVIVTGIDDPVDDGDIAYLITGSAASSDTGYNGMPTADVAVTNVDDDTADIVVSPLGGSTTEAGGIAVFGIVLDSQPTADVSISIASGDTTEGIVSTSSLTFNAANWNVVQTVTVTGVDDTVADSDIAYSILIGTAASADAAYNGLAVADVAVTNVDNDTAGITVSPISGNTTEAGGVAAFSVVLTSQPIADVTIGLASSNTAEGTPSVPTLTFTAANWNVAQVVTVTGHSDTLDDGDVSYKIVTQPAQSRDPNYQGSDPADVVLVNKAIDDAPVVTARSVLVEQGGTFAFRGDNAISVADANGNLATVQVSTTHGTLDLSLAGGASLSAGALGSSTLTLAGSQSQIQAALATLTYRGATAFHGDDALVIIAADRSGQVDRVVVTVAVAAPNNAVNQPGLPSDIRTAGSTTTAPLPSLPPAVAGTAPNSLVVTPLPPAVPRAPSAPVEEQATSVALTRSTLAGWTVADALPPHSANDDDDTLLYAIDIRRLLVKLAEFDIGNGSGHGDGDPSMALAWTPDDDASTTTPGLTTEVLLETVGLALSVGGVWWALRVGGLLTSLLASMPAWRQVDLLPVLADEAAEPGDWEAGEDDEAALEEEAMARALSAKEGGTR